VGTYWARLLAPTESANPVGQCGRECHRCASGGPSIRASPWKASLVEPMLQGPLLLVKDVEGTFCQFSGILDDIMYLHDGRC